MKVSYYETDHAMGVDLKDSKITVSAVVAAFRSAGVEAYGYTATYVKTPSHIHVTPQDAARVGAALFALLA